MSAFIETTIHERDALVNVDAIEMIMPDSEGEHSIIRFRRPFEQTQEDGTMVCDGLQYNEDEALEPYDSLKAKILAATVKEEKENLPPTPPIREKGETRDNTTSRARTREKFVKPTVEDVAAHIREKGYTFDAEEFWNFYESKGWRVGKHVMKSWASACVTWQKARDREERREAARTAHIDAKLDERTAHIDAKMDEREAKLRWSGTGRRKADNNVEMSDEVREEVRRDFTF